MTADTPASSDGPLVAELSEDALLARIFPLLPVGAGTHVPPGDDAAVVAAPDGRFVVTTDVLVEDRHFRRAWSSGEDVGRRAAVQNLADVAAMGARPTSLVVALVVPADLPVSWVEGLARGLAAECAQLQVGVVGGDLSGGPVVVVSVTAHGDLAGRAPVLRSGARPGDVVAHAGVAGRSAAGLALLEAGRRELDTVLVDAHLRPVSPLDAGPAAADAGATAMLDVSDGLLRDAGRIARASGVRIDLDADAFTVDRDRLRSVADELGAVAERWVLDGGEDHGLLATFPAGSTLPVPFRAVGRVGEGAGVTVDGVAAPARSGWDHFGG
ncbi:thiamine-phosphate kinase [Cellulomonas xylanilytica]|uniref:Thiamine-monophosphate kinase n=1 Tax=Cellulomonas xylanilytica TaxID=233583 RepID=A0A510V6N2_9CELL|nr:thiamine-phosphate kinase [Cellulomonas xylanilytica]GEK21581.1 thiamine-monophosphate kinase [Cellulomonas xylanilytica]